MCVENNPITKLDLLKQKLYSIFPSYLLTGYKTVFKNKAHYKYDY